MKVINKISFVLLLALSFRLSAQEYIKAPSGNLNLFYNNPVQTKTKNSNLKITAISDTIPFFEDFYYAPSSPYPTGNHWTDSSVFINSGFAISPPSIGVATFDGLNKKGYPYNIAATTIVSAACDTLTSKPINMFTKGSYTYSPADSMGFSLFYQAKGFGENPAVNDSLILEFFKPLQPIMTGTFISGYGVWNKAWGTRGNNSPPANDSSFKRVFVRISDTAYFHDGFRFRLRNKATPSGSVDHWHVDYIEIKPFYTKTDSIIEDVSFTYVPRPMLKNYSAMPWYQYQASEMGTNFSNFLKYTGTYTPGVNCSYNFNTYTSAGTLLNAENKGANNIFPFTPTLTLPGGYQNYAPHANPLINYTISTLSDSTSFIIKHYLSATTAANNKTKGNDTVYQKLEFNNFYAYDDGSAESVYYHNTYGAKDAIKFTLNVIDTLRALDIFFDPFTDGNIIKNSQFRMYVWADGGGQPGALMLKDSAMKPIYLDHGYNKIPRYFFTSPLILNETTYYIGMQQITNQPLYVGFDRNLNRSTKLFYDVGSGWTQSAIPGSLMIHPVFGEATRALVGIQEQTSKAKEGFIKVYPNPASDKLFISAKALNDKDNYTLELYSTLGNKLAEVKVENTTTEINLSDYASGIYFLTLKQNNSTVANQKFIISR